MLDALKQLQQPVEAGERPVAPTGAAATSLALEALRETSDAQKDQCGPLATSLGELVRSRGSLAAGFATLDPETPAWDILMAVGRLLAKSNPAVIVDADQRAVLSHRLHLQAGLGLADVLGKQCGWSETVVQGDQDLHLLPAGRSVLSASAAIELSALFHSLRTAYPVVLYDLGSVHDLLRSLVLRHCEAVVLLVRIGQTDSPQTAERVRQLQDAGARLRGVMLVRAPQ